MVANKTKQWNLTARENQRSEQRTGNLMNYLALLDSTQIMKELLTIHFFIFLKFSAKMNNSEDSLRLLGGLRILTFS